MEDDEATPDEHADALLDSGWMRWLPWQATNALTAAVHHAPELLEMAWGPLDPDEDDDPDALAYLPISEAPDPDEDAWNDRNWRYLTTAAGRGRPATYEDLAELLTGVGLLRRRRGGGDRLGAWYMPKVIPLPAEALPLTDPERAREDSIRFYDVMREPMLELEAVLDVPPWERTVTIAELAALSGLDPETVRQALPLTNWHAVAVDVERIDVDVAFEIATQPHEDHVIRLGFGSATWTVRLLAGRYHCPLHVARRTFERLDPMVWHLEPPISEATDDTPIDVTWA